MADNSSNSDLGIGIAIAAFCIAVAMVLSMLAWQLSENYRTRQDLRAEAYQTCIELDRDECTQVFYPD